jgi:hypothetical protein
MQNLTRLEMGGIYTILQQNVLKYINKLKLHLLLEKNYNKSKLKTITKDLNKN